MSEFTVMTLVVLHLYENVVFQKKVLKDREGWLVGVQRKNTCESIQLEMNKMHTSSL